MPSAMHVHLQLRIVGDDGTVFTDCEILRLEKSNHRLEAVGLSIGDSKTLQERLQQHIVTAQAAAFVNRHRCCPACGRQLCQKGKYPIVFRTVFGNVALSSPRFYRCGCQPADSQTFSPLTELFIEHTAPELLYLETRWASLISFGLTAALLKDVLPVAGTTNPETVRQHLHRVADRHDADLGREPARLVESGPAAGQASPVPREAVIVGIDGGYLRNWHDKKRNFGVSRTHLQRKGVWSCTRDEGGPLEVGSQVQASNHCKLRSLRAIVVNVAAKGGTRSRQVRSGEASESEPLMTCRNASDDVETGGAKFSRDELGGCPEDCPSGIRYVSGAKPDQALVRNVRTCRPDAKGETQAARTARVRVPKRGTGAEWPVVGVKVL
jgi:hypothetical protein